MKYSPISCMLYITHFWITQIKNFLKKVLLSESILKIEAFKNRNSTKVQMEKKQWKKEEDESNLEKKWSGNSKNKIQIIVTQFVLSKILNSCRVSHSPFKIWIPDTLVKNLLQVSFYSKKASILKTPYRKKTKTVNR